MKFIFIFIFLLMFSLNLFADEKKIDFRFSNVDLSEVIQKYSKESGQKFVYGSDVMGKVTIETPNTVTLEEAYNLMVHAMASRGYGAVPVDGIYDVMPSRDLGRSGIPLVKKLPTDSKESYMTYIYTVKTDSSEVIKTVMHLQSKSSSSYLTKNKQILITDWLSNLKKIDSVLAEIDQPTKKK